MRQAQPLAMILAPNDYSYALNWTLAPNQPALVWLQFQTRDALTGGTATLYTAPSCPRRYLVLPNNLTVRATFPGRLLTAPVPVVVMAVATADDRSTWSVPLTAAQADLIGSGPVKLEIGTGSTVTTFVPQETICLIGGVKVSGPCADGC